jgi:hypothetical protein
MQPTVASDLRNKIDFLGLERNPDPLYPRARKIISQRSSISILERMTNT